METKKQIEKRTIIVLSIIAVVMTIMLSTNVVYAVDPQGPDNVTVTANETKGNTNGQIINISGGRIATMNLSATIQNPRWKGFVGQVIGSFTLSDSSNSKLYDWTISALTGRVYTTRNSSSPTWANVNCSNITTLNQENILMNHTNTDDNLNRTFNYSAGATHSAFYVGTVYIPANTCPTLNTYVNNATQDTYFQEMALYDRTNIVYATIINSDQTGFDGLTYDFQMIVPENGLPSFQDATAYYLYVELG